MLNKKTLAATAEILENDGVICYPTEAVWGLGCHPRSRIAFEKILTIKNRPNDKGVILIASSLVQLVPYMAIDECLNQQLAAIWPGFITCVLPKSADCPEYLSGKHDTIAVRLTTHPVVAALCEAIDSPLVSTSANISGQDIISGLVEAKQLFANTVDGYVDAPLGGESKPSRIVQFTQQQMVVIRE